MSPRRIAGGRRRAARVILALAAVTACLGAVVAYAATRSGGTHRGLGGHHLVQPPSSSGGGSGPQSTGQPARRERLLRPQLLETPPQQTEASETQFRFRVPPRTPAVPPPTPVPGVVPSPEAPTRRFQCKLDGEDWSDCSSPYRMTGLAAGTHRFAVRVFNREERVGETVDFGWQQLSSAAAEVATPEPPAANQPVEPSQPRQFAIEALREPEGLMPGFPPQSIPVRVSNPNPVPIEVTALTVAIGEAPDDCSAENFQLTPASASPEAPLAVPAEGSVDLPAEGIEAPAMQMLNLPVEQDACRDAEIPLVFSGEAQG